MTPEPIILARCFADGCCRLGNRLFDVVGEAGVFVTQGRPLRLYLCDFHSHDDRLSEQIGRVMAMFGQSGVRN